MNCLYCDKKIGKKSLLSLFIKEDELCPDCRKALKIRRRIITVEEMKVETFFDYDSIFRSILLQFKECYDEALKKVFLYELNDYLALRYHGYRLLSIPSSSKKRQERGFDHLRLIFEDCGLAWLEGLKMKEERSQEGLKLAERRKMKDNYIYEGQYCKKVLIVDDVMTTGSSLLGAYRCLKPFAEKTSVLSLSYKSIKIDL